MRTLKSGDHSQPWKLRALTVHTEREFLVGADSKGFLYIISYEGKCLLKQNLGPFSNGFITFTLNQNIFAFSGYDLVLGRIHTLS